MKKSVEVPSVKGFEEIEKFAKIAVDNVCWPDEFPYKPEVEAAIAHTGESLLVKFTISEDNVRAVCLEPNGPVWEDSCAEFFVKVPGSEFYYNFETNCIGTGLAARRRSRSDFARLPEEEMAKIKRRSSLPAKPVDSAEPATWTLELEIPFEILGCKGCPEMLEANFYKCGDKTAKVHFLSWNPVLTPTPDFHRPEFFGSLILK